MSVKIIITQTFTMARWQIVVKKSEAKKQSKDRNFNNLTKTNTEQTNKNQHTQNNKTGGGGREVKKQITNRMV